MTLGQLLLLVLIVAVVWLASKLKRQEERLDQMEDKDRGKEQ